MNDTFVIKDRREWNYWRNLHNYFYIDDILGWHSAMLHETIKSYAATRLIYNP